MQRALRRSVLIASVFAAVVGAALVMGAGTAKAGDVVVHFGPCFYGGGQTTAPAGSTISVLAGWVDVNRGVLQNFLLDQTTTMSVNDGSAVAITYGAPFRDESSGGWVALWTYPTGVTLANPGDTMTFTIAITVAHPFAEELNGPVGFGFFGTEPGKPIIYGPGPVSPYPSTCTVTAT